MEKKYKVAAITLTFITIILIVLYIIYLVIGDFFRIS
ncbi:MAG: hypothetical protein K0R71_201 [Bacillales bacterium]|jgi:hypothetical protein|nr:hypothetical protein [Bacillales bacterium]